MALVGERRAERGRRVVADAGAARSAVPAVRLVEIPQPVRPGVADRVADQRPVLVLDLGIDLGAQAAGGDRARIPAHGGVGLRLLRDREPGGGIALAARLEGGLARGIDELAHGLGERRQRGLAVAGDGEVDVGEAAEVLVVGLEVHVAHAERDDLGGRLVEHARAAHDAVAERRQRAPVIVHLDGEDDVRLPDHRAAAEGLVERMAGREVLPPGLIDHRALQRLGERDEALHAGRRARHAIDHDERGFRRDQQLRRFRDGAGVRLRRHHLGELRNVERLRLVDRVLLQLRIEREQHRAHRRRGRDLVGTHRRLGEMLQRGRLVVPLGEVAGDGADVDRGMHPFRARPALVRLHDVAADRDHRHPVAPGVVQAHGGVLETDDAVADHRERLALDLGIAVRHLDRDLFMRAGQDLRLDVAAVIDDRLVEPAEARGAVHRQIFDVEHLEDVAP